MPQLEVRNIYTAYGLSRVLFGVSFAVESGQVVALVGRNGVGKTTIMRSIIGLTPPYQGQIIWRGQDITGWRSYRISKNGIGFVPEDRRIFPELTVWENLDVARRSARAGVAWDEERIFTLFPALKDIQSRLGGVLSGGEQQMLTIARSLMGNPELLLLDEPSEGLAPRVVEDVREQIRQLKEHGLSIVLAEQNLDFVLSLSDYLYVLEKGEIKYSGTAEELRASPEVLQKYLAL